MDGFTRIIVVSLVVSASATVIAMCLGVPLAALLAMTRFPGRRALVVMVNALLGLPPVVVGLALYLLLSRAGPLGSIGILFTPSAMVLAQSALALPIVPRLRIVRCKPAGGVTVATCRRPGPVAGGHCRSCWQCNADRSPPPPLPDSVARSRKLVQS